MEGTQKLRILPFQHSDGSSTVFVVSSFEGIESLADRVKVLRNRSLRLRRVVIPALFSEISER